MKEDCLFFKIMTKTKKKGCTKRKIDAKPSLSLVEN